MKIRTAATALGIFVVVFMIMGTDVSKAHRPVHNHALVLRLATTPNVERDILDLPNLSFDRGLTVAAQRHANDLCEEDTLRHSDDITTGLREGWSKVGENVGVTQGQNKVAQLREAFNNSPTHRAIIVDPAYTRIGFGTCNTGVRRYVVYRFSD